MKILYTCEFNKMAAPWLYLLKIKGYIFLEYIIQKNVYIYIYINILLYLILVTVLSLYTLRLISLLTSMNLQ